MFFSNDYCPYSWYVFLSLLMAGLSIASAYCKATLASDPRSAYRWLQRAMDQLSRYRSLFNRPDETGGFDQRSQRLKTPASYLQAALLSTGCHSCPAGSSSTTEALSM
jgi:hypothetical protein